MLPRVLRAIGHYPTQEKTNQIIYKSPFNPQEKTPSFFVFPNHHGEWKNFKDYSSGLGGDVYAFIMELYSLDYPQAKEKIKELTDIEETPYTPISSFNQVHKKPTPSYKIISTQKIETKRNLLLYLNTRGITETTIKKVDLSAICYEVKGREYYAIGFKNNSDGYEIRNAYFKGNLINKDITTIKGTQNRVKVFEGFIDYLSYVEMYPEATQGDYIVMNSVSLLNKTIEQLRGGYDLIELYLDQDKAGDNATAKILEEFGSTQAIIDKRSRYGDCKDINDLLIQSRGGNDDT